jgi:hypothetical protein
MIMKALRSDYTKITVLSRTINPVFRMNRRRAKAASRGAEAYCCRLRATDIMAYLETRFTLEDAQARATHESPRRTDHDDRSGDQITPDKVEWIAIW